jgi:aldose 1-epimerase
MYPTGEQYELRAGDYAATVTQVGAVLRGLRYGARDLVRGFRAEHAMPLYRGAVLAPWPNRVADGRYSFASSAHQLPVNEIERGCALHGLVAWDGWLLSRRRESSLRLEHRLWPRPGYPFLLALDVSYELQEQLGLSITLSARNDGMDPAPYGASIHPYLVAGPGRADDWSLRLQAATVLAVDPIRLRPHGESPVSDGFDFRHPRPVGPERIDHAFTALNFDADDRCTARLRAADGAGVQMARDSGCRWVQVHTADRPEPSMNRVGLALEPMTCPPDAFNSGIGLECWHPAKRSGRPGGSPHSRRGTEPGCVRTARTQPSGDRCAQTVSSAKKPPTTGRA